MIAIDTQSTGGFKVTDTATNENITTDSSAVTVAGMSGGRAKTDIADILTALAALAV